MAEATTLRRQADDFAAQASELESAAWKARAKAKRERPTWLNKHRDELLVNILGGVIVGLPFFALGVLVALLVG